MQKTTLPPSPRAIEVKDYLEFFISPGFLSRGEVDQEFICDLIGGVVLLDAA